MASLVLGKLHVTPLKLDTIPRLELTAAVLVCNLAPTAKDELEFSIDRTVFCTDSTIASTKFKFG